MTSLASPGRMTEHVGHGAEGGKVLDRLVRGAVFADADGVVCEDVDNGNVHGAARRMHGAHVIAEVEEGGAEGASRAEGHAVEGGGHAVFADTEVEVAAA